MITEGWELFEEAVEEGAPGDLSALLRALKGKTTPPPPTPVDLTADITLATTPSPSPSPAKKVKTEGGKALDQPVMVLIGGTDHGPAPSVAQSGGQKMAVMPIYGRPTWEKPWYVPSAAFPPIIWTRCRGMKRNTSKILYLVLSPFYLVSSL